MSRNNFQTIVMFVAFFMFIVVHALFRFALGSVTNEALRQGLGYLQFFLYGSLFLVGLSALLHHKFKHILHSSRPKERPQLIKVQAVIKYIHFMSYGYYALLILLFFLTIDVDDQRLYHYLLYLANALLSAFLISKYQNQNPFVMDR